MLKWLKQKVCKHHFKLDALQRDEVRELSYMRCTKCNKLFEEFYGYHILSHGTFEAHTSVLHKDYDKIRTQAIYDNREKGK